METQKPYDVMFCGAKVVDGNNHEPFIADVAISADRIMEIGHLDRSLSRRVVDVGGLVLSPGFIDPHTHDDNAVLRAKDMIPKVSQGVTTVITGNCGISLAPFDKERTVPAAMNLLGSAEEFKFSAFLDYLEAVRSDPASVNVASMVGHTTLRAMAMSDMNRSADSEEVRNMQEKLESALDAGAIGISTGTFYADARAASTDELLQVCRPLGAADGIYSTHLRSEADDVVDALNEAFHIGESVGAPVVISHHKVLGKNNFGRSRETLALISEKMKTQRVALDMYPYVASSTILEPSQVKIAERTIVTWCKPHPEYTGKDFSEIMSLRGESMEQVIEALQPAGAIYFTMCEKDIQRIMGFPHTLIGSDGLPSDEFPHPRLWGTFPRVIGHYCRDLDLFPLQTAVWKMTKGTAEFYGLRDRGEIRKGAFADIVIFDEKTICDTASFQQPKQAAAGIKYVYVNGECVWEQDREHTGQHPGRQLRREV